ncbi:hypothetical protein FOBRF1_001761 [Fusarium oxysporum]
MLKGETGLATPLTSLLGCLRTLFGQAEESPWLLSSLLESPPRDNKLYLKYGMWAAQCNQIGSRIPP